MRNALEYEVRLKRLNLLVTKRCNLRCSMCDYRMTHISYSDLALEKIKELIKDAHDLGLKQLELSGGEPMLRREIYDIIQFAGALGIHVVMMTNGTLIGAAEVERLIGSGLTSVVVSLEGFEATNDAVRGEGSYRKALDAVALFLKSKERIDHVKVAMTITKHNYNQLYDFTKYLFDDIGVSSVSFNPFTKFMLHETNYHREDFFSIPGELLFDLERELEKVIGFLQNHADTFQPEAFLKKIPDFFAGKKMLPATGCSQPLYVCAVETNGLVYPCFGEYRPVGNVNASSIKDIVKSPEYQSMCKKAVLKRCSGCLSSCYDEMY